MALWWPKTHTIFQNINKDDFWPNTFVLCVCVGGGIPTEEVVMYFVEMM